MRSRSATRVRFGDFEVDLGSGELFFSGPDGLPRKVVLQEQPFRVLRVLIERDGQPATRDELRKQLWPNDTEVDFDHSINVAIGTLRRLLGDSAANPKYIETIGRRGYRLMVPVERLASPAPQEAGLQEKQAIVEPAPAGHASEVIGSVLTGKRISNYRVLELIGGGGMGMVYKAEDLRLGRRVALKFLPEELSADPNAMKRFEREAQTASTLNHPNICTIYAIDEFNGQPFIAMELLEGETLRDRLAGHDRLPFSLQEILSISIQVCNGLQAAHHKGIIHRDIKPANIFVTRGQTPKILDFGLAKLIGEKSLSTEPEIVAIPAAKASPPQNLDISLTTTGMAIGTAGYMSPEQIRKENLDGRTDIFSFGLVLYEMACGRRAFTADSFAAVHYAIQSETPVSILRFNKSLPPKLADIVNKALEKDRDRRYQSAEQMRQDLEELTGTKRQSSPRVLRPAVAAALVAVVAAAGVFYWHVKTANKLSANDTIVVADVTNQTADPILDDAINLALADEFAQTPYFNVLGPDKIHETLSELHHDPTGKVTPQIARDVCLHTNSSAIITSTVKDIGNAYDLQLKAVDCRTEKPFATTIGTATRDQMIHVLGAMAEQLRVRAGEPRSSVAQYSKPLEIATSASPEALQDFAKAQRLHMSADKNAINYYRLAIDADPNFALAHIGIGAMYGSTDQHDLARIAQRRAYELRDRLTGHDRFLAETIYDDEVLGEYDKYLPIFQQWVQEFPTDLRARVNYGNDLKYLGRFEDAVIQEREAARLWPNSVTYRNLIRSLAFANRVDEAKAAFREAQLHHLDDEGSHESMLALAEARSDQPEIEEQLRWAKNAPFLSGDFLIEEAGWYDNRGQIRRANEVRAEAERKESKSGDSNAPLRYYVKEAMEEAEVDNQEAAKQALRSAVAGLKGPLTLIENDYLALVLARAGEVLLAQKYLAAVEAALPSADIKRIYDSGLIRAAIQLDRNDPQGALRTLEPVRPYDYSELTQTITGLYPAYIRGLAYLKLGDGSSAAAEFQKLIGNPYLVSFGNASLLSLSHLQLARAQVLEGDKAAAKKTYEQFLTSWKDADSDLPILKEAKAEYASLR